MANDGSVAVSRRIAASAAEIFGVLTDPRRHVDLDGSGMVRSAVTTTPVSAVGDVFVIAMHYSVIGDYEMNNHVVEFEQDRRIGWEPESGRGHPDQSASDARWGHRWVYDLEPDGPDATIVTETYDCSQAPAPKRVAMSDGRVWLESMAETLQRLDQLCASGEHGSPGRAGPSLPHRP